MSISLMLLCLGSLGPAGADRGVLTCLDRSFYHGHGVRPNNQPDEPQRSLSPQTLCSFLSSMVCLSGLELGSLLAAPSSCVLLPYLRDHCKELLQYDVPGTVLDAGIIVAQEETAMVHANTCLTL